jgi:hypothetical protein
MTIYTREALVERRAAAVRWGAVFAGGFVALGAGLLLQELVVGVGLSNIDERSGALGSIGIATSWWFAIVPIIALFFGGLVAGRLSGIRQRGVTALHGAVVWALTTTLATVLALYAIGSVAASTAKASATMASTLAATGHDVSQQAQQAVDQVSANVRENGPEAGRALLWVTLANAIGLAAAVVGGAIGAPRYREREIIEQHAVVSPPPPAP